MFLKYFKELGVKKLSWGEDGIIREKGPRINEGGFNSAGKWQLNTVEDVEHINIHCRKYNSAMLMTQERDEICKHYQVEEAENSAGNLGGWVMLWGQRD